MKHNTDNASNITISDDISTITTSNINLSKIVVDSADSITIKNKLDDTIVTTMPFNTNNSIISTKEQKTKQEKENNIMKMDELFGNVQLGPVKDGKFRLSMYGISTRDDCGNWVAYNTATNELVNVAPFSFDASNMIFIVPIGITQVAEGDLIMHNNSPVYVRIVFDDGTLEVLDIAEKEIKTIYPLKSMFGFNFVMKVMSLFSTLGIQNSASEENPFGNFFPLLMLSDSNKNFDTKTLMMLSLMQGNNAAITSNPLFMMMLMADKDGDSKDFFPLLLMSMNNNKPSTQQSDM